MASSVDYKMIILVVVSGYLFATTHADPELLQYICSKTIDIEFCLNVFGSDPATRTASLPVLGQLAIAKATDKATTTRNDIESRSFSVTDPRIKDALTQCLHAYHGALAALRIAPFDLRNAHYADLVRHARDASLGASACERAFNDESLPSPVTRVNLQLEDYCSIIMTIAGVF